MRQAYLDCGQAAHANEIVLLGNFQADSWIQKWERTHLLRVVGSRLRRPSIAVRSTLSNTSC